MKILHLVQGLRSGGVAQIVYDLVSNQHSRGCRVDIVSIHSANYDDEAERFNKLGVKIESWCLNSRYDLRIIYKLASKMREYDVVHVHLFPNQLYASLAIRLLPHKVRPRLITTEHSTWNNRRKYGFLRSLDKSFYKSYDAIIAISPEVEKSLNAWLKSSELTKKVITITNGVNIDKFKLAPDNLTEKIDVPSDGYVIGMVSRLEYPKDPATLLKAVATIPNLHTVIIGDGPLMKQMKDLAHVLKITDRTHFLGHCRNVQNLLKGFTIGCLSTKWDGFGLVAVEYMAAGLPVLVSDVSGLREVVGDSEALFPVGDEQTLAIKIRKLLRDPKYYADKVAFSNERCWNFSIDKMINEYWDLYTNLLK